MQRAPDQEEDESTHHACSLLRNSSRGNQKNRRMIHFAMEPPTGRVRI
jgi:hypothetical protein